MKLLHLPLLFVLYLVPGVSFTDQSDKIDELVRQGNAHDLAKLFAPGIELTIPGDENVYSKTQAELVLGNFFSQNKPRSVKVLHNVNSNPVYRFEVLIVTTDKGTFRMAYTLKGTGGNFLLIELRIETEKVK